MNLVLPAAELIILVSIVGQRVAQIIWQRSLQIYKVRMKQCNCIVSGVRLILTELGARSGEKKLVYCYKQGYYGSTM